MRNGYQNVGAVGISSESGLEELIPGSVLTALRSSAPSAHSI